MFGDLLNISDVLSLKIVAQGSRKCVRLFLNDNSNISSGNVRLERGGWIQWIKTLLRFI